MINYKIIYFLYLLLNHDYVFILIFFDWFIFLNSFKVLFFYTYIENGSRQYLISLDAFILIH